MRLNKFVVAAGISMVAVLGGGTPSFADGSVSPKNVAGYQATVTVKWADIPANETVIVMQCVKSDADASFNQISDCSQATFQNYRAGASGSGSGEFVLFGGNEPNGEDWGCGPLSTTTMRADTCYVRMTTGTVTNTSYNEFFPVRFQATSTSSDQGTRVPLVGGAAAVGLAAVYVIYRKTRTRAAV